jgi:hypothetical protein
VHRIGAVKPNKVKRVASPVAFGPPGDPDVTKALDFGVTRLFGRLYFSLDPSDQIVLTDSATVSVEGPERPPTPRQWITWFGTDDIGSEWSLPLLVKASDGNDPWPDIWLVQEQVERIGSSRDDAPALGRKGRLKKRRLNRAVIAGYGHGILRIAGPNLLVAKSYPEGSTTRPELLMQLDEQGLVFKANIRTNGYSVVS